MSETHKEKEEADVRELIRMSRAVGGDPTLVQGGGGNTSVKSGDGETMVVKASGTPLGAMEPGKGYCRVSLKAVLDIVADPQLVAMEEGAREREALLRLVGATVDGGNERPSIESSLHAFLGRVVCHTHPMCGNAICCTRLGSEIAAEWFGDLPQPPVFMPFVSPGLPLARAAFKRVRQYTAENGGPPKLIFLKNHGVFVSAESVDEAVALSRRVNDTAKRKWEECRDRTTGPHALSGEPPPEARRCVSDAMKRIWRDILGAEPTVVFSADDQARTALAHPEIASLMRVPPLTPDHVVYAHGQPLWIAPKAFDETVAKELADALEDARLRLPRPPVAALVAGVGLFAAGADRPAAEAALAISSASLVTLLAAHEFGGCRGLTPDAIRYLEEWEVEAFRRKALA